MFRCGTKWKTPEIRVFSSTVSKKSQKELCADLRTSSFTCSGNMPTVRTDLQFNIKSRGHNKDLPCPICASYTHIFTAMVSSRNLVFTNHWVLYLGENIRSFCIWTQHPEFFEESGGFYIQDLSSFIIRKQTCIFREHWSRTLLFWYPAHLAE